MAIMHSDTGRTHEPDLAAIEQGLRSDDELLERAKHSRARAKVSAHHAASRVEEIRKLFRDAGLTTESAPKRTSWRRLFSSR